MFAGSKNKVTRHPVRSGMPGPAVHVPHRSTHSNRKNVHLGRLYMRPVQWHLKNNWKVLESLEKMIPVSKSLHSHLQWWLDEDNVLQGQQLHPLKHALQIFTATSKNHSSSSYRQHYSGCLHKQGGGTNSHPLCALLSRILQETGDSQSSTHPRSDECDG